MNRHDLLAATIDGVSFILPELALVGGILAILLIDLFITGSARVIRPVAVIGVAVSVFFSIAQWHLAGSSVPAFSGMIAVDRQAVFWKVLVGISTIAVMFMNISPIRSKVAEYYLMLLSILVGANFLIVSSNLLMLFFSMEMISVTSYIVTAFLFNKNATEAALKYLLFGATASATMLYGLSLLYAQTGTLGLHDPAFTDALLGADAVPLTVASVLVLAGFLFKLMAAPMHLWGPDVYQAAPTPAAAYFSVVPKLAALAVFIKIMLVLNVFGQSPVNWMRLLSATAMLSIFIGNLSALWQRDFKRLMAYSSVAQTGFLIGGFAAFSPAAMSAVMFYAAVFAIANLGVFFVIGFFERQHGFINLDDYSGLISRYPFMAICTTLLLLSLTGLPPLAGFTSKLLIFTSVWESYMYNGEKWLLYFLVFGLVNTVVSLFYYIKIPYYMIFKPPKAGSGSASTPWAYENFFIAGLVLAVLLLFFIPNGLADVINSLL